MTTIAELRRLPWHDSPVDAIAYDPQRRTLALDLTLCELPDGGPPGGQSGRLVFSGVDGLEGDALPLFDDRPDLAGEILRLDWREGQPSPGQSQAELLLHLSRYPGRRTAVILAVITFAEADWRSGPAAS